jgi:hypothetical protein
MRNQQESRMGLFLNTQSAQTSEMWCLMRLLPNFSRIVFMALNCGPTPLVSLRHHYSTRRHVNVLIAISAFLLEVPTSFRDEVPGNKAAREHHERSTGSLGKNVGIAILSLKTRPTKG